jgi:heat shock protein HslJ
MVKLRGALATLAAASLAAVLAAGAGATSEPEETPMSVDIIEGITWILSSQAVDGELVAVPDRALVSLLMVDGQAGGQGGCNSYFSSYELDGSALSFGPIGSTMMACLPPLMDLEQAYFANLAQVASFASTGGPMALLDAAGNTILEFEAAPEATVVGAWVATGINNQQDAVVTTEWTPLITADFSPDGDLTGFDGCNDYFTTYDVDGDRILVDPAIGSTRMACPSEEVAEESQWFYGALTSATTWSLDAAGNLELRDDSGALQVSFAPAG